MDGEWPRNAGVAERSATGDGPRESGRRRSESVSGGRGYVCQGGYTIAAGHRDWKLRGRWSDGKTTFGMVAR